MAKQQSMKSIIYQQIANQQVQQVLGQQDLQQAQQLIAQYQPNNDDMALAQNLLAQYPQQPAQPAAPVQQATVNEVKSKKQQEIPSLKQTPDLTNWFKPVTASGRDVNAEAAQKQKADADRRYRENYQRQQQEEAMAASYNAEKEAQKEAEKTYQQNGGDIAVGATIKQLDSLPQIQQDIEAASKAAQQQEQEDLEKAIYNVGNYVDYDVPQLTEEEQALEEQILNSDDYQINKPSDRESLAAFGWGLSKLPFMVSKGIADAMTTVGSVVGQVEGGWEDAAQGRTDEKNANEAKEYWEEQQNIANENYQWMKDEQKQAQEEHPFAYGAGTFTTQAALYALTGPVFDGIAAGAGVESELAKFFINQGAQNVQDLVLDTAPLVKDLMEDGSLSADDKKEILNNILWNAAGNAVFGGISEIPNIKKWAEGKDAADAAFRNNAQEGAEKLAKLAEDEPIFKDADNAIPKVDDIAKSIPTESADDVVKAATEQADVSNLKVQELNGRNGTKLYQVVSENGNLTTPVEPGKVYKSKEAAEQALETHRNKLIENSLDELDNARYYEGAKNVDANNGGISYGTNINGAGSSESIRPQNAGTILSENGRKVSQTGQVGSGNSTNVSRPVVSDELRKQMNEAGVNDVQLRDYSGDYKSYSDALSEARKSNPHGAFVDAQSVKDLQDYNAKAFMSDNGGCGVAVKDNGNIVGVFKNSSKYDDVSKAKGAARDELITARANGGDRLDCYGADLVGMYSPAGFEPTHKVRYERGINPDMDAWCDEQIKNLIAEGKSEKDFVYPDIVFMKVRDGESIEDTLRLIKEDKIPTYDEYLSQMPYTEAREGLSAYEVAEMERNALIDNAPKQGAFFDGEEGLKERGQSVHMRGEGKMQMEGVADEVAADFKDNPDMYSVLKNADTKAKAEKIYAESANPETEFRRLLENKDPAALPLGHQIAKDYSAAGNYEAAAQIYRDMGEKLTEAGQFTQAAAINMMKDDPMTALMYAERQIDALNEAGRKRFGSSWVDFKLTDDEIKAFSNIEPGDAEAIKKLFDNIGVRIGKDYPTTFMDKLLEGRKVAMLFNVRTNVRNVLANVPTLGLRWLSDRADALGQQAAHLIDPEFEVTQSLTGSGIPFFGRKQNRQLATEAWNSEAVQAMVKNTSGKYEIPELSSIVGNNKQMYKGTKLEKWIDDVTGGGIQKVNEKLFGKQGVQSGLETIRNATYKMLDLGDSPFVRENFIERLSSYINAKGIKNLDDIPDEAIQMAWEEAMKATYKDNSWAVQMLSGLKQGMERIPGVGRALSQAAIPFVQAPGNIAARMIDYSPIKAGKGIIDIISAARKGDAKAVAQGINEAAKGLTGTGLVVLGMKLREAGILTGSYSEDKDQRAFEKQNGFKEFALHVGDQYFTYDWAQPFAESLIIGTLLQDAIMKSDEYNSDLLSYIDSKAGTNLADSYMNKLMGTTTASAKASVNSWFEESPLQGLQELLSGGYTGGDIAGNLASVGFGNFASAFIPSTLNAVAKTLDPVQRNANDKSNTVSKFVQEQQAKIPGLSDELPAKYDTWGREMKYADNPAMAFASRFLIPGDYSYDKSDAVDNEINRLYEEATDSEGNLLKDIGVFPQVAPDSVGGRKLNNEEASAYQQDMGQRNHQLVETFINADAYNSLSDTDKINAIEDFYKVSKAITERDLFGKEVSQNKAAVEAYDSAGGGEAGAKALVEYYTQKAVSDSAGVRSDSSAAKAIQADVQAGNMEAAQEKVDAATQLQSLGLDKPGPIATYYKAVETFPSLTPEEFAKTFNAIDKDHNQGLKKAEEVIPYMNSQNMSYSEGMKFWNAYANEKWKIPKLEDGTWK